MPGLVDRGSCCYLRCSSTTCYTLLCWHSVLVERQCHAACPVLWHAAPCRQATCGLHPTLPCLMTQRCEPRQPVPSSAFCKLATLTPGILACAEFIRTVTAAWRGPQGVTMQQQRASVMVGPCLPMMGWCLHVRACLAWGWQGLQQQPCIRSAVDRTLLHSYVSAVT